jgi:hypothetical protein
MPGSRAAVLVRNDDAPNVPARPLQLRNESFDTGPGPVVGGVNAETGDTWPDMVLAEVNVEGPQPVASLTAEFRAKIPTEALIQRVMQTPAASIGRNCSR